jgi:hypothetical protein
MNTQILAKGAMMRILCTGLWFLFVQSACAARQQTRDGKAIAKAVYQRAADTVVSVRLVVKLSMGGRDQEQKTEIIGTVIDPTGLTVISAAATDPGAPMRALLRARGGSESKLESSVSETTLLLSDGTELEADVVLKDADLDLAFVRPRDTSRKLEWVELKPGVPTPQVLDELISAGRHGRSLNRAPWVQRGSVSSVIKGPRPYALASQQSDAVGTIAYSSQGVPVGIFVTHIPPATDDRPRSAPLIILRPVQDVLELAEQAKKANIPEPTSSEGAQPAAP